MPDQPKTILYLRPDTIGDLVLFTPALKLFMTEWPAARHVVVVREGYEELAPVFSPALEWKIAHLNPFTRRPAECRKELTALLGGLTAANPDLILAPTLNRTWLEIAVAANFKATRSVVLGGAEVDPIFAASLRLDLGVDASTAFRETVAADRNVTDVENQHRFAEFLIGRKLPRELPSVAIPPAFGEQARSILSGFGLNPGRFASVFPGGLANVTVKSWPSQRFAEVVAWLQSERKMPVLLLAHVAEKSVVEEVSNEVVSAGGIRPAAWLGHDGTLPLLGALLKASAIYIGHDTGAMHLAAAVGRPVVGIFGGGHWPRFRPSASQSISVVQPLPCFGCNWDCHFSDGPCVKTITADEVCEAIRRATAANDRPFDLTLESQAIPDSARKLIAAATPGILRLKRDRVERQHKIEELKAETDLKDTEIAALKAAAEERKREMEAIKAELEQECADKDQEIAELKTETDSKDVEIAALKVTCDEREQLIIRLDGGLREHIQAASSREARLQSVETGLARATETLRKLPPDASEWAKKFHDKDVHIGNIEGFLRNRDEQIEILRQSNANYLAGYRNTELAKHYGNLLSEKEAVIRELHRACLERDAVINQVAADSTRPTSALRKHWIALAHHLRENIWRPIDRWLFRKVVEDYWMQIGVLRQYDPRPIGWDRRLSKSHRTKGALPKVGIVTPSFAQPAFLESTILSVLNQEYPNLIYVIQDGASQDRSVEIITKYASRLRHWVSEPDDGQADAVRKGFTYIEPELGPNDIMAWFNSDDLLAPRALRFVASYFAAHPDVDVVYGHRIIIDDADREIGRWIMPRHEADSVEWIDYVPQETLFWRKRAWDLAGGIDPSFQFALDWDLLARFRQAGCKVVRLPYFLGCFRVHPQQKTSQAIHTTGAREMSRIRSRFHGPERDNATNIERHARRIRFRGALTARLHAAGIRW